MNQREETPSQATLADPAQRQNAQRRQRPDEIYPQVPASVAQSKSRASVIFFTTLSTLACMLALANVAMAATPSGQDQYLTTTPNAGGTGGDDSTGSGDSTDGGAKNDATTNDDFADDVGGSNGVATTDDVKKQAEKNKAKLDEQGGGDTNGPTGTVGAGTPGGGGSQPPSAANSAATAAKFGPFSRNTAVGMIGICLVIGLGAWLLNTRAPSSVRSGTHGGDTAAS